MGGIDDTDSEDGERTSFERARNRSEGFEERRIDSITFSSGKANLNEESEIMDR